MMSRIFPGDLRKLAATNRRVTTRSVPGQDATLFAIASLSSETRTKAHTVDNTATVIHSTLTPDLSFIDTMLRLFDKFQSAADLIDQKDISRRNDSGIMPLVAQTVTAYIKALCSFPDSVDSAHYKSLSEIMSLTSLLLFTSSTGSLLPSLKMWYKHTNPLTQNQIDDIRSSPVPSLHPHYWEAVVKSIGIDSGLFVSLLKLHPEDSEVDVLTGLAPLMDPSKSEFMAWHRRVTHTTFKRSDQPSPQSEILAILQGDHIALSKYINATDILGHIFTTAVTTNPLLRASDLMDLLAVFPAKDIEDGRDKVVHALLRMDVGEAVVGAAQYDAWLGFHLANLMMHAGIFDLDEDTRDIAADFGIDTTASVTTFGDIRGYLLNSYAELLYGQGVYEASVRYLMYLPNRKGHAAISRIVQRIPLEVLDSKTQRILVLLKRNGMYDDVQYVYTILARRAYDHSEWQDALLMYLYARNEQNVASIVSKIVEGFFCGSVGRSDMNSICNAVGGDACETTMLASSCKQKGPLVIQNCNSVQFLFQVTGYQAELHKGDVRAAGKMLGRMVESRVVPARFECAMLECVMEMCVDEVVGFGVCATYEGMRLLEVVERRVRDSEEVNGLCERQLNEEMFVFRAGKCVLVSSLAKQDRNALFETIRIALTNNLARAYIEGLE